MGRPPAHVRADDEQSGEQSPPLEPGDWLTRDEFERRYEGMPQGVKAELQALRSARIATAYRY
jgi:hypothetical protein